MLSPVSGATTETFQAVQTDRLWVTDRVFVRSGYGRVQIKGKASVSHITTESESTVSKTFAVIVTAVAVAGAGISVARTEKRTPNRFRNRVVTISEQDLAWNSDGHHFGVTVNAEKPVAAACPVIQGNDEIAELLNQWFQDGTAVGLSDVLYDNHDRRHSSINLRRFPQMIQVRYADELVKKSLDHGLQCKLLFDHTTIGNSSTAHVGSPYWRSQPRLALGDARAMFVLAQQYFKNHLYCYPEHRDYDAGRNGKGGFGDTFSCNTPFVIISQGSSFSDQPFMAALATTVAAFHPQVYEKLCTTRTLCSTVQMILRRSLKCVEDDSDYLSGRAHPPVFDGGQLDVLKMMHMAHDIRIDEIPPIALLQVVHESLGVNGRDYFDIGPRENLLTTRVAIARMCRTMDPQCRMTLSAGDSHDFNGRALTWHWKVLQGDPRLITIEPQNPQSTVATITVRPHTRRPVRPGSKMESPRVDIGVFVDNGVHYSTPAIVSLSWPEDEVRQYDADGRILSVQYSDHAAGGNYVDPFIITAKNWRDDYEYASTGVRKGWMRTHPDNSVERFTYDGSLVIETDLSGRPRLVQPVKYQAQQRKNRAPLLARIRDGALVRWQYDSDTDELGKPQPPDSSKDHTSPAPTETATP